MVGTTSVAWLYWWQLALALIPLGQETIGGSATPPSKL